MTKSDNEWYNEWQQVTQGVTTSGTTSDKEWQRVTTNGNEWPRLRTVVQRMKTAQYTSKNGWLPSFQWQKEIHYYLKRRIAVIKVAAVKNYLFYITPEKWMAATASVKKITLDDRWMAQAAPFRKKWMTGRYFSL